MMYRKKKLSYQISVWEFVWKVQIGWYRSLKKEFFFVPEVILLHLFVSRFVLEGTYARTTSTSALCTHNKRLSIVDTPSALRQSAHFIKYQAFKAVYLHTTSTQALYSLTKHSSTIHTQPALLHSFVILSKSSTFVVLKCRCLIYILYYHSFNNV